MSEDFRDPPWAGAAENVVPGRVDLTLPLGRAEGAAAWLTGFTATPEGVGFTVTVVRDEDAAPGPNDPFAGPDGLRLAVRVADGREATLTEERCGPFAERPAGGIALTSLGGGGWSRRWDQDAWLWPLPPEGDVTFTSSWGEDVVVDAAPLRAAAGRAVELWADARPCWEPGEEEDDATGGDVEGDGWVSYAPVDAGGRRAGSPVVPGAVGVMPVLLRTEAVAVWLGAVEATPDGIDFTVNVAWRGPQADALDSLGVLPFGLRVELADGRSASSDDWDPLTVAPPDRAMLRFGGGESWGTGARHRAHLRPLPPEGPLRFVVCWPEQGVDEAVTELDAAPARSAAERAVVLWPDEA